ncbi:pentatricopeptide repeat-containing protein At2g22410, mitochondrial [Euphorbia lathyris]|uniref:pentatricopeptide repeat-containing protein At2g22410, mitochondrial n=1 Tax=Euphorbia lathyris TaxID=212925 RepID=UPI0033140656
MRISHVCIIRSQHFIPKPSLNHSIRASSLKPTCGNKANNSLLSNPLLFLLQKCESFSQMKQIQAQMIRTGLITDGFASSRLIAFCAGSEQKNLDYCAKLLLNTQNPNSFSWNVAIRGYLESENPKEAIVLYRRMLRSDGSMPDNYTYPLLFKVCTCLLLNFMGHQILGHVLKFGFDQDMFVRNASIHMMVAIGELELARKVFDESPVRNLVSWNSLINGYAKCGKAIEAIGVFREMMNNQIKSDAVTMIGVVSSCAQLGNLKLGREFHRHIEENGLILTIPLSNALMDMYVKCGDLAAAKGLFDNMADNTVVSWTTMVLGYAKHGFFDTAKQLFLAMPEKNVVTWNAMIGSYVKAKQSKEAIVLFNEMQTNNIKPDRVTLIHCLSACSQLGALEIGIWIHHYIKRHNLSLDVVLGTSLVDMYAKCGNISKALQVFDEMPCKNALTWTSIIGGLALHGNAIDAISYFSRMIDVGLIPDEITYLGVLSACCHGGLVEEGKLHFTQMKQRFNISPELKHYSSMVDLLGRAGLLEEADELIQSMPIEADAAVWGALFFACRVHGNLPMGERAASKLLELDPNDSGTYVLLANMYRESNKLEEARTVRRMMRERGVEKVPGSSAIEVNGVVSEFIAKDKMHPQSAQVYGCLIQLTRQIESADPALTDWCQGGMPE